MAENFTPMRKNRIKTKRYPSRLQRLAAIGFFFWRDRFFPGGLAAFNKCTKDVEKECSKWQKYREKRLICSGNKNYSLNTWVKIQHSKRYVALKTGNNLIITTDQEKSVMFANYFFEVFIAAIRQLFFR